DADGSVEALVRCGIDATLRIEGALAPDVEVGVLVTDDEGIRRLSRDYRGIDAPTDVLAFAMRDGVDADLNPEMLGDVVISIETAQRQADERGHAVEEEMGLLAVHATLHLLGYDHEDEDEGDVMEARQTVILDALRGSDGWDACVADHRAHGRGEQPQSIPSAV
ncbi:rRNA maturation RNase YbeY, partial [Candidatus Poribacteria bacterium]|nr:rRNA maturation RNase YbeY [Candidatus Poribacteria bacterium]